MTTITLYGDLTSVRYVAGLIEAIDDLVVERSSPPTAVSDGSGRYRVFLSVTMA